MTQRSMSESTEQWLCDVGLTDNPDPDVAILREASIELDLLNTSEMGISDKDRVAARKAVRYTVSATRKSLQRLLDDASSVQSRRRHQLVYADMAATSLGWIDADLLTDDLRDQISAHLIATHDITLVEYEPRIVEI